MNREITDYLNTQAVRNSGKTIKQWKETDYSIHKPMADKFKEITDKADIYIIMGDYDVDGVMSSKIMKDGLHAIRPDVPSTVILPDRFRDGYGIKKTSVDRVIKGLEILKERGRDFKHPCIITVDNGIAAVEEIKYLKEQLPDASVIVTDHHIADNPLGIIDAADLVCNPHMPVLGFAYNDYCGAGVAYKLFEPFIEDEALKDQLCMYAGIATVADVVPMQEDNWRITRRSLEVIRDGYENNTLPAALSELLKQLGIEHHSQINEDFYAWKLSPAINAMGRMQSNGAKKVFDYLDKPHGPTDTIEQAGQIIANNKLRKGLVNEGMKELKQNPRVIAAREATDKYPLWLVIPDSKPYGKEGLCGLFASQLAEWTGCPSIVLTPSTADNIIYKGSCRQSPGFDMYSYLRVVASSYLKGFGGHKEACGVTADLEGLRALSRDDAIKEMTPFLYHDETTSIPVIHDTIPNMVRDYRTLRRNYAPFGKDFTLPVYEIECKDTQEHFYTMGEGKHFWMKQDNIKIIHFNHDENVLADPQNFKLRGNIAENYWNGTISLQFIGQDIAEESLKDRQVQEQDLQETADEVER